MDRTGSKLIVRANDKFDHGETLTNKTSQCATMYGCRFANGLSLRPFVIFNAVQLLNWLLGAQRSSWINATTHRQHMRAAAWNELGGSTTEVFLQRLKCQFGNGEGQHHNGQLFRATPKNPVVVLLNGHGSCSHWSMQVLGRKA